MGSGWRRRVLEAMRQPHNSNAICAIVAATDRSCSPACILPDKRPVIVLLFSLLFCYRRASVFLRSCSKQRCFTVKADQKRAGLRCFSLLRAKMAAGRRLNCMRRPHDADISCLYRVVVDLDKQPTRFSGTPPPPSVQLRRLRNRPMARRTRTSKAAAHESPAQIFRAARDRRPATVSRAAVAARAHDPFRAAAHREGARQGRRARWARSTSCSAISRTRSRSKSKTAAREGFIAMAQGDRLRLDGPVGARQRAELALVSRRHDAARRRDRRQARRRHGRPRSRATGTSISSTSISRCSRRATA